MKTYNISPTGMDEYLHDVRMTLVRYGTAST